MNEKEKGGFILAAYNNLDDVVGKILEYSFGRIIDYKLLGDKLKTRVVLSTPKNVDTFLNSVTSEKPTEE